MPWVSFCRFCFVGELNTWCIGGTRIRSCHLWHFNITLRSLRESFIPLYVTLCASTTVSTMGWCTAVFCYAHSALVARKTPFALRCRMFSFVVRHLMCEHNGFGGAWWYFVALIPPWSLAKHPSPCVAGCFLSLYITLCASTTVSTTKENNPSGLRRVVFLAWCRWSDSNRHGGLVHRILSPARLPISPHRRGDDNISQHFKIRKYSLQNCQK